VSSRVWLIVDPGPARFSDEHCLWYRTVNVFSTREAAIAEMEARIPGIVWHRANPLQGFLIGEDATGDQWALMRCTMDDDGERYPCHSGEHAYHRSRGNALQCKAKCGLVVA
jgi:hypothetical protein